MKRMTDKQKKHLMRKARQLAAADIARRAGKDPATREAILKMTVGKQALLFQPRVGYFSPRTGPMYTMSDLDVAEALDNPNHMVTVCAKLGFSMLSQVLRYKTPAPGQQALKDLAELAAKLMKLDVEALRKELEAERAEQAFEEAKQSAEDNAAAEAPPAFVGTVDELEKHIEAP